MAASSSSLIVYASYSWRYDVFLSFRGEDTRNNFTSHLFAALKKHDFNIFHDTLLLRGQEIAPKLSEAIEQSQISIVVFSKNYADSRWCLDELVKINDCRRRSHPAGGHKVLPVFLDVEPSDVRNQEGCYKQAFLDHYGPRSKFTKERTDRWREALSETGDLSGHHLQNHANGDEEEFVRQIVKEVALTLKRPHLDVADHPVGIEPRVREVYSLLNDVGSDGVGIVVIRGIGGIGKTTIAKATFNLLAPHFECCSFLADVRSTFGQVDGLVKLQKQLISDLRNEKNTQDISIHNYHQGTEQIKRIISHRRVLLVVDDIDSSDSSEQLERLAIGRENLLSGSRVLVTTRDSSCSVILGHVSFYEPRELNKDESLKLFTRHAIGNKYPDKEGYEDLLEQVNQLAGGLPLVLKVWGRHFGMFKVEDWHLVLSKLRKVPHGDVQAKLRISYDSLDDRQKRLFLDIACFFVGMKKEFVIRVLEDQASGWFPKLEIEILLSRCLVYVDDITGELLKMHDVTRDMGREIIRQESPDYPEKRTRLWDRDNVLCILRDCSGTKAVESIILNNPLSDSDVVSVKAKAFKKLRNLRLLHFRNVQISGTYKDEISFKKLKCLRWRGFPLKCLPINLNLSNLVALKLNYSRLEQLWEGTKRMNKLRILDVSHSIFLIRTPNFSGMRSLEVLKLHDCTNLKEVDESVLCLDKLVLLDMSNCKNLRTFPLQRISQLISLKKLHFSGCSNYVPCEGTPFSPLPAARGLGCMTELDISYCNLYHVPSEIGSLESLRVLRLSGNMFSILPDTISKLQSLERIHLNSCVNLHSIPDLPRNLSTIYALGCISLMNLPPNMSDLQSLTLLLHRDSVALKTIPHPPGNIVCLRAHGCLSLETTPPVPLAANKGVAMELSNSPILEQDEYNHTLRRFLVDSHQAAGSIPSFEFELSGTEVPRWFNYRDVGECIQFLVPCEVRGWIFCVINSPDQDRNGPFSIIVHVVNRSCQAENNSYRFFSSMNLGISGRSNVRMWVCCEPIPRRNIRVNRGDDVVIRFTLKCDGDDRNLRVEKCGVHLIYEDEKIDDQKFTKWMHEVIDSQPPHDGDPGASDSHNENTQYSHGQKTMKILR